MKSGGWRVAAAVAAVTAAIYGLLLTPGTSPYSPHSDILAAHLTIKGSLWQSLTAGSGVPFWRSDFLAGIPGLTHPQTLYTNPFHFLFYLLPPVDAMGPTLWLHFLAAGLAFALLGGVLGLGPWPRLILALAGLTSFKLIAITYAGWLSVLPSVTCGPLFVAAVLHLIQRPGLPAALWLAAAVCLGLHSGHLQLFFYPMLLLAPYLAGCAFAAWRRSDTAAAGWMLLGGGAAAVLGIAMTAYLMLPLAAEAPLISRSDAGYRFFLGGRELVPRNLLSFLHPEINGTPLETFTVELWESVAYFGAAAQLLAVAGVFLGWRRRHTRFLATAFALSLLLGFDTPLTRALFQWLPGFALFRSPNRFLFVASLFGITLAGVGAAELLDRLSRRAPAVASASALALAAAIVGEGAYYAHRYLDVAPRETVMPHTGYRALFDADDSLYRVAPLQRPTLNYGWAAGMGLELITAFEPYNFEHYQRYFDALSPGRRRSVSPVWTDLDSISRGDLLDALNVKYVVSPVPFPALDGYALERHFRDEERFVFYRGFDRADVYVYRNTDAFGRAFFAPSVTPARDAEAAMALLRRSDLRELAIVEGAPSIPAAARRAPGVATVRKPANGRLLIDTTGDGPGYLVVSEVWHPGWRATLDGAPVPLFRTDVALLGLELPAGAHRIELRFRPLLWGPAVAITALGWSLFAAGWGVVVWRRRRGA